MGGICSDALLHRNVLIVTKIVCFKIARSNFGSSYHKEMINI
jgi:hypothetical protein